MERADGFEATGSASRARRTVISIAVASVLATGLSGCATSGAMTLMSLSASGVSFAVSGKSLSDHALSAVLNRDCAVWRPVKGEPVCREAESEAQRLAILEPVIMAQRPQDVSREQRYEGETSDTHHATSRPGFSVGVTPPPQASAVSGSTAKLPFGVTAGPRQFWVVGSFSQSSNATRLANELSVDGSAVLTVRLAAGLRHRVIIGPQPQGNALIRDAIATRGVEGAWPLTLCVPSLTAPPCLGSGESHLLAHAAQ